MRTAHPDGAPGMTRTSTSHPDVVLQVEVLRMWQRDTKTVAVRWTLRCAPRLTPGRAPKVLSLDGISEYKFNSRGFIREHTVRPPDLGHLQGGRVL